MASGFSETGWFAAGVPGTIVVVIGCSVVVLMVEVKWISVSGCTCRNLPGHCLQMPLMMSLLVAGSCWCRLKVRMGSRGTVTMRRRAFSEGAVIVNCLEVCALGGGGGGWREGGLTPASRGGETIADRGWAGSVVAVAGLWLVF